MDCVKCIALSFDLVNISTREKWQGIEPAHPWNGEDEARQACCEKKFNEAYERQKATKAAAELAGKPCWWWGEKKHYRNSCKAFWWTWKSSIEENSPAPTIAVKNSGGVDKYSGDEEERYAIAIAAKNIVGDTGSHLLRTIKKQLIVLSNLTCWRAKKLKTHTCKNTYNLLTSYRFQGLGLYWAVWGMVIALVRH